MTNSAVFCLEVNKSFATVPVVQQLTMRVEPGHILALLGPSGCGKTTTLRLIAGFEQVDSGRIDIAGQTVADGRLHLPPEKRRVGMVFQDYAIFPHLDVAHNVAFGVGRGKAAESRTEAMLELVGLAGLGAHMPYELSGGQQQRIALARALAPEPAVLLLDEPFSNLDTSLRVQVRREVRELLKRTGTTAIFVTHDQEEALFIGDEVAVMNGGRLEQMATPYDIFHRPQSRFVAEFMGHTDFVSGRLTAAGVETVLGSLPCPVQASGETAVEVAVRPDDVALTEANNGGNGRIVERRFMGIANIYQVTLADGSQIHSWQPHTVEFAPGTAVQVSLRPGHAVSCFVGGKRLEIGE